MNEAAAVLPLSFADYIALEERSTVKHQMMHGELFDMAGGTPTHARLGVSVSAQLFQQLQRKRCHAYSSDLRVRAGELTTYPDVTVVCGRLERDPDDPNTVVNPTLIVEVLSDSTEAFDRGEKFAQYRTVPTLREYVVVSQHRARIEVFTRSDNGWTLRDANAGQRIEVASIGCVIDVDEVYAGVFEESAEPA